MNKEKSNFTRYKEETFKQIYENLKTSQNLLSEYAVKDKQAVRRCDEKFHIARPNFVKDIERIINSRYFNRYTDKTQVFSLYKNDDISRRALHVQLVSRIARNIGRMLNLNQDLIEAISLGHDLGHAPFGHVGEAFLSEISFKNFGEYFHHNVQSVRILDNILNLNLSVQTLDGILCHNGEKVRGFYKPNLLSTEDKTQIIKIYDDKVDSCRKSKSTDKLIPFTIEGCVVALSDIIAYLGKDRQDTCILGIGNEETFEENEILGASNSEFIFNLIADIINNSYGEPFIKQSEVFSSALNQERQINFEKIYKRHNETEPFNQIEKMYNDIFEKLYDDLTICDENSPIFKHHINILFKNFKKSEEYKEKYKTENPHKIVIDYISGMTDDYFLELYKFLFPNEPELNYHMYF